MPDMRFAPPLAMRVGDRGGGLNQTSVRTYNERLVMSLLRQRTSLSRMELGQHSGLSAQTVSVIVRALEKDGLVLPGEVQRGRVGPPLTPILLNPDGAFSIGVSVAATAADVVLVDFSGSIRRRTQVDNRAAATSGEIQSAIAETIVETIAAAPSPQRERIVGIGIGLPEDIDSLHGHDPAARETWSAMAVEAAVARVTDLPIFIQNDVTAAAGAEVIFGAARTLADFVYISIGRETEHRLVLHHRVYAGSADSRSRSRNRFSGSLASLIDLEERAAALGCDPSIVRRSVDDWHGLAKVLPEWIAVCSAGICETIETISAFVEASTVIIGGRVPPPGARKPSRKRRGEAHARPASRKPADVARKRGRSIREGRRRRESSSPFPVHAGGGGPCAGAVSAIRGRLTRRAPPPPILGGGPLNTDSSPP